MNNNFMQIVNQMMQIQSNNPLYKNVLSMANKKDFNGIEQMARNICKERGIDADKMFNDMKNKFNV